MARETRQRSGGEENGGRSDQDVRTFRAALDGNSDPKGAVNSSNTDKGEAPATGALRDFGTALDGRE